MIDKNGKWLISYKLQKNSDDFAHLSSEWSVMIAWNSEGKSS